MCAPRNFTHALSIYVLQAAEGVGKRLTIQSSNLMIDCNSKPDPKTVRPLVLFWFNYIRR